MASNNLVEMLGGSGGLARIASELGVDQQTAMAGAAALMPAILGGFKKQAAGQPAGLEGLVGLLGGMGGGSLLDSVLAPQPTPAEPGNRILGEIFGSKDVSRTVAGQAAGSTGISADLLKKMLPILAMAAAGYMAKGASAQPQQGAPQGGIGGLLGQVMGGLTGRGGSGAAGGGFGGLAQMLDLNGDGNPLDDILRMAGKRLGS